MQAHSISTARCMEKFIFRSLVLGGVLFLLLYIADITISNFLKTTNGPAGEYQVWNDIYQGNVNADLAIYGSSRAWVHISPAILKDSLGVNAYNFGLDGHSFWLQYLRNLEYQKYNRKPSNIILSLDVFTLSKNKDLYKYQQFFPYMLWNEDVKLYTESYNGFDNLEYTIPLIRYKGEFKFFKKMFRKRLRDPLRTLGYMGNERRWDSVLEIKRAKNKSYTRRIDSASVNLLHQFIKECKADAINLIFVYTPEHITGQNFVRNRDDIMMLYENIASRNKIPFLDYSNDTLNFSKEYFYNASHLNKKGSQIFSKQLAQDLKPLLSLPKKN